MYCTATVLWERGQNNRQLPAYCDFKSDIFRDSESVQDVLPVLVYHKHKDSVPHHLSKQDDHDHDENLDQIRTRRHRLFLLLDYLLAGAAGVAAFVSATAALLAGLASSFLAAGFLASSFLAAGAATAGAAGAAAAVAGFAAAGAAAGAWANAVAVARVAIIAISCFMVFSLRLETYVQNYSVHIYLTRQLMVVLTKIGEIPEKPDRNTQYLRVTVCQRVGPCFDWL